MNDSLRVAVVGGGPAGSTCAFRLARGGAHVTLFEAEADWEKPCGGGVPSSALRDYPELADPALPRRVVSEVLLFSPRDRRSLVPVPEGLHLFRRQEMDSHLRERARASGAEVVRARVTAARRLASGAWELRTEQGSFGGFRQLVAADGVQGAIGRSLAGPYPKDRLTLALYAYVPGVVRPEVVLKFFGSFNGYLWAFPRVDHVSVGICAAADEVSAGRLHEELHAFCERHYPEGRVDGSRLKGYFIPSSKRPPRGAGPARGDGWAVVGDSAGFVDPITREGIAHAMRSGARVAHELLAGRPARTPELDADLRWAHGHGAGFYRETFLESMVCLSADSSSIRGVLGELLAGRQRYRGLKRRLLMDAIPCGLEVGWRTLAAVAAATVLPRRA